MKTHRSRLMSALVLTAALTYTPSGFSQEKSGSLKKASEKPATVLPKKTVKTVRHPVEDQPDYSSATNQKGPNGVLQPVGPKVEKSQGERVRGVTLGFQTGYAVESFKGSPVGLKGDSVQPPILSVKFGFNPRYKNLFQPLVNVAASILPGSGVGLYLEAGALLDWPGFHLSGGLEGSVTLDAGEYQDTLFDNSTEGAFIRGALPLGRFYPSLDIRKRQVDKTLIARKEGLGTYTQHEEDFILRPAVRVDLNPIKLQGAVTFYQAGNTAIGSKEFGIGVDQKKITVYTVGVGYQFTPKLLVWLKANQVDGVEDETAHYYQVPQLYPDFMLAKNSLFLEAEWTF